MLYVLSENSMRDAILRCTNFAGMRVLVALPKYEDIKSCEEKIEKLLDLLQVKIIKINRYSCEVRFHNGSLIYLRHASESIRGRRANIILYDSRVDNEIVRLVLAPCLCQYWGDRLNSDTENKRTEYYTVDYDDEDIDMNSELLDNFLKEFKRC